MYITFKQFFYESNEKLSTLAKKLDIPVSTLAKMDKKKLKSTIKTIGRHDFSQDSEFDPDELKKGEDVEKEHTDSVVAAKLIAKDHLKEIPDYYSRLHKMEKGAK